MPKTKTELRWENKGQRDVNWPKKNIKILNYKYLIKNHVHWNRNIYIYIYKCNQLVSIFTSLLQISKIKNNK